jgi:integrase
VFPTRTGNIEAHANIIARGLQPALVAAGVVDADGKAKYTGMHALRHFYASWCINRRVDGGLELSPKVVMERMGHSNIAITLDVYGHLFPQADGRRDGGRRAGVPAVVTARMQHVAG